MSRRAARKAFDGNATDAQKTLLSMFRQFSHRYSTNEVFSDFVEVSAIAISNAVDRHNFAVREERYMAIAKRYEPDDFRMFPQMLGALVMCYEERLLDRVAVDGLADVLGQIYMMLGLGNERAGQFFTPYSVSRMMAQMSIGDGNPFIDRDGFVTVLEPACGAGGMVIACADALQDAGRNYQQTMHATCIDIDTRCVHMTYLQLALLHVPAIVVHGNGLTGEAWSHWFTPAHILGAWGAKLRRKRHREALETLMEMEAPEGATEDLAMPDSDNQPVITESVVQICADPAQPLAARPALRVFVPDDQLALF